ncbi:MAG: TRAP transporter large permease subunit, partial [Minwuiales bacterium]|nr:TRAP transporter large permease subunit [Minwuiales bacterium]
MTYEMIALVMFSSMMAMLLTGQRVFAAIGFVAVLSALLLWGDGGAEMAFSQTIKLMKWYPLLTLPLFIYMGYVLSESGIADDLYRMFHVWFGPLKGGLAIGTIGLMVVISAMNGLSVAGMAFGAIGFVAVVAALLLWGEGGSELSFSAAMKLMKWYPLLTLPLFIYMGYMLSESGIANDLYRMFHVWFGPLKGGLAVGTIGLMVAISAMNGLSVAGMAIGASIALPELLR